jgi:hypothetical protein
MAIPSQIEHFLMNNPHLDEDDLTQMNKDMYRRASCHSLAIFVCCYFLLIAFHGYEKVFEDPFDNWDFCRWYCLFFMLLRFMGELYVQSR